MENAAAHYSQRLASMTSACSRDLTGCWPRRLSVVYVLFSLSRTIGMTMVRACGLCAFDLETGWVASALSQSRVEKFTTHAANSAQVVFSNMCSGRATSVTTSTSRRVRPPSQVEPALQSQGRRSGVSVTPHNARSILRVSYMQTAVFTVRERACEPQQYDHRYPIRRGWHYFCMGTHQRGSPAAGYVGRHASGALHVMCAVAIE